eukprot:403359859
MSFRQYQNTHVVDRENQEMLENAKRQLAVDLLAMIMTCISYSIGMSKSNAETDLCGLRIGPWLELFIFYQGGATFLNLAVIFQIQNHIIQQIGLAMRTVYEESKFMTFLKFLSALALVYILIVGNQIYYSSQSTCLGTNKLFFYTLMLALIYCFFQLMIVSLIIIAFILLLPILLYFWCTRRNPEQQWVPSSQSVLSKLKKIRFGKISQQFANINAATKKDINNQKHCQNNATEEQQENDSEQFCSICLQNYNYEDYVTMLPCDERHAFHTNCIEIWLNKNNICPLCKKIVEV